MTGPCLRGPSRALVDVRTLSPFVGRGHELRALHAILDQVADGRGQSVGIVGEPGIGKSRLLFEFSQQLHTHGPVTYLEGHCLSYTRATPYSLVLEVLRAHCAIATADGDDVIAEKVHRTLGVLGVDADRTAAYLLHLLGVRGAVDMLSGTSPDTLKAHTFAALKQLWIKSGRRRPLVIAVEDMHWIDPTSEEFVTTLVDGLPGAAVLLLATYRPGYRAPWVEKSYTTQLPLPPLSATDSAHVVQAVLHQETALSPLADAVLAKAQGNPFFLEELARMLVQRQIQPMRRLTGRALRCSRSTCTFRRMWRRYSRHASIVYRSKPNISCRPQPSSASTYRSRCCGSLPNQRNPLSMRISRSFKPPSCSTRVTAFATPFIPSSMR